jgi:hypothetical protein
MSFWSGLAAAGVAFVVAFVALGEPVWVYETRDPGGSESWSYGAFVAHETVYDSASGIRTFRNYSYDQLAGLPAGRAQPNMARVFGEFQQLTIGSLVAASAGIVLALLSQWRRLRGIFAGFAFLAASALTLFAVFTIAFAIPVAASRDFATTIPQISGGTLGGPSTASWQPWLGWYLPIGTGLGFAWASSDLWHVRPVKKRQPAKVEVIVRTRPSIPVAAIPPPPNDAVPSAVPEPVIEEVFLIASNGLLIKHMSRTLMTDKDRDVVGSMISAISSFVREAFTERDGEIHEVSLGEHRFVMCNDSGVVLAVLLTSGETEDVVHRMQHLLALLRDRYGQRLATWQGEAFEGIEDELAVLWEPYHLPPPPAT